MSSRHAFGATDVGLLVMALIWGINYSVVKVGLQVMPPLAFNGLRVMLAASVLGILSLALRRHRWPVRRDVVHLLLLGLVGNGLYQMCFILGLARTRAGIAALVTAAGPAYIAIISQLLGRDRTSRTGWIAIALQLLGVGCVVRSSQAHAGGDTALLGAILIACGSVLWALFSVLLRPYTERAHPIHLSAITMASGASFLLLLAAPSLRVLDLSVIGPQEWGAVLYAGLGALVIAYLLFYRGVQVLGPTRTAMYSNLQPVIALAVAWIALHEQPSAWQLAGAACIMAGLLLSRFTGRRPTPAVAPRATTTSATL